MSFSTLLITVVSEENMSADNTFEANASQSEGQMPDTLGIMENDMNLPKSVDGEIIQNPSELSTPARKKTYLPQNLNPTKMTEVKLLEGIANKTIYAGPPPPGSNCKSTNWDNGIQFVYFTATNMPVTNWFICSVCGWTTNCWLSRGTNNMRKHVKKHITSTIKITKDQLARALWKSFQLGKISPHDMTEAAFKKLLPPNSW